VNETELLFTGVLNCRRADLYLDKNLKLDSAQASFVSSALKRRISREPIQYILGRAEFMGLEFKLTADVFIPRPETEILVETVLKLVQSSCLSGRQAGFRVPACPAGRQSSVLDLGTGSGCIAIALAKYLPNSKVTALDVSKEALIIAKENARLNKVEVKFMRQDLFGSRKSGMGNYDIIVSNPPYILSAQIDRLQPEIRYEPRVALDGGKDGLDFYRRIIALSPGYLKKSGFLILEMGLGQRQDIENILEKSGNFKIKEVVKDYGSIERVIVALKRGERWIS